MERGRHRVERLAVEGGGVRYHERAFFAGPTESGKSELLNFVFSGFRCQRLLYDTKGHE